MPTLRPLHTESRLTDSQIWSAQNGAMRGLLSGWLHARVPHVSMETGEQSRSYFLQDELPRLLLGKGSPLYIERRKDEARLPETVEEQLARRVKMLAAAADDKPMTSPGATVSEAAALVQVLQDLAARVTGDGRVAYRFPRDDRYGHQNWNDSAVYSARLREALTTGAAELAAIVTAVQDLPQLLRQRRPLGHPLGHPLGRPLAAPQP